MGNTYGGSWRCSSVGGRGAENLVASLGRVPPHSAQSQRWLGELFDAFFCDFPKFDCSSRKNPFVRNLFHYEDAEKLFFYFWKKIFKFLLPGCCASLKRIAPWHFMRLNPSAFADFINLSTYFQLESQFKTNKMSKDFVAGGLFCTGHSRPHILAFSFMFQSPFTS